MNTEKSISSDASCIQKFNEFFWKDYPIKIAIQQLNPAPWANSNVLFATRFLSAVFLIFLPIYEFRPYNLAFFTHWGIYFSSATFILLTIHEFRIRFDKKYITQMKKNFRKTHKPLCSYWKWCTYFYQQTLVYEVMLVIFFWIVLFPGIDIKHASTYKVVTTFIDHLVPVTLLMIDFVQNSIHYSFRHLVITEAVLTIYGLVNLSVTKINHQPVYPVLSFDSFFSWALAFSLPLMDLIIHTIFFFITKKRTQHYQKNTTDEVFRNTQSEDFDQFPAAKLLSDSIVEFDESQQNLNKYKQINLSTTQSSNSVSIKNQFNQKQEEDD